MPGAYLPATTMQGGMAMGVPDTCLVPAPPAPPIPTPFPNVAQCAVAVSTSTKVLFGNMPVVTQMSQLAMSSGDEAGVNGGVMSGMIMGPATFKGGSSKVFCQGQPVVMVTTMTAHNGVAANLPAGGAVMAPSQAKVLAGM